MNLTFKDGSKVDIVYPIRLKDNNGNETYYESSNGYWIKRKFDERGNQLYLEDSTGYWTKREYDDNGNKTYFENSFGNKGGTKRSEVVEMTMDDIEKLVGKKVKVVK